MIPGTISAASAPFSAYPPVAAFSRITGSASTFLSFSETLVYPSAESAFITTTDIANDFAIRSAANEAIDSIEKFTPPVVDTILNTTQSGTDILLDSFSDDFQESFDETGILPGPGG